MSETTDKSKTSEEEAASGATTTEAEAEAAKAEAAKAEAAKAEAAKAEAGASKSEAAATEPESAAAEGDGGAKPAQDKRAPAPAAKPSNGERRAPGEGPVITMRELLAAGVHFGHQTKRWNPKMRPYIYGARNGIHIIDLQRTLPLFVEAYKRVVQAVANGLPVLFVGTKKQAQDVMAEEAQRAGMFFVTNRWLGGTLTNYRTVRSSIDKLQSIEATLALPDVGERLTKKERLRLDRLGQKLERNLGGIKNMPGLPGIMFVVDPRKERIAVAEARKLEIEVVGVTDTNCDPDVVDWVIPGNDDAIRAIRLFASKIADACLLGQKLGRELAVAAKERSSDAVPEPIRVSSGGDGPKVEVVSRRSAPRPEPEAAASPNGE